MFFRVRKVRRNNTIPGDLLDVEWSLKGGSEWKPYLLDQVFVRDGDSTYEVMKNRAKEIEQMENPQPRNRWFDIDISDEVEINTES